VGGHLTALRRTASGPFTVAQAAPVEEAGAALLADGGTGFLPLAEAAATVFPVRALTADETRAVGYGQRITATGAPGPHAAVDPDGRLAALVEDSGSAARVTVGFPPS
jgi:tRNA pseudouridine55 synthase